LVSASAKGLAGMPSLQTVNTCVSFSLPFMKTFNKTDAAIFPMQAMLPVGFPFSQLNLAP